jgi:hypothetical protein
MVFENLNITSLNEQIELLIQQNPWIIPVLLLVAIWKMTWYGMALFYAAKRNQKIWFVLLLVCAFFLNDLGLLAIVYVFVSKRLESLVKGPSKFISTKKITPKKRKSN